MVAMFKAGKSLREIGEACGMSHCTVRNRLIALKVKMKPVGRKRSGKEKDIARLIAEGKTHAEIGAQLGIAQSTVSRAALRLKGASNA